MSLRGAERWEHGRFDVPAGLVVFLVALPLCLGVAQASGAPLVAGIVAGALGGIVVSSVSGSALSVSGPAAGLVVVVATGIQELGFSAFLVATALAGIAQILMGALRLGAIAHFFPSSVIKGMLTAIGVLIILKQAPFAVGYDPAISAPGLSAPHSNSVFAALAHAWASTTPAAIVTSVLCTLTMAGWPKLQRGTVLKLVPPALVAVVVGAITAALCSRLGLGLAAKQLVALPTNLAGSLTSPDFSRLTEAAVWQVALTVAAVASLETLLCLEAVDRLDPERRISPPNRELVAQGVGNVCAGLLGGLPITSVIVRSSANVQAGAKTRLSAIVHGIFLLLGLLFLAPILNLIPLAALAVVLLFVGYKLTPPTLWRAMWRSGPAQFLPFVITVIAIVSTDLLKGTLFGVVVGLALSIRAQQKNAIEVTKTGERVDVIFHKDMTFLQKARIKEVLREIPAGATVVVDRRKVDHVDDDIEEVLDDYAREAPHRAIRWDVMWEAGGEQRRARRLAREAPHGP
jgi:carbonic anhydrase